ncbi:hypothetical protein IPL85_02865 [Candidatus Saccharibacteria bacterium]|nr:MAG: hypothetical protein IPL85_02865 [Candidatus Saccharibacteria bacterium]
MNSTHYDVIAFGGCYLDIISTGLPFEAAGVPVEREMRGNSYLAQPGGSAINMLRTLQKLGGKGIFIGVKGDDVTGRLLEQQCTNENLTVKLFQADGRQTNFGLNMVGQESSHVLFSLGSANQMLTSDMLLPALSEILTEKSFLYMGTLFKLDGLAPDFYKVLRLARLKGSKIVVDHGRISPGAPADRYSQVQTVVLAADYYLPSKAEFLEMWQVNTIEEGLRRLHSQAKDLTTVVKDGGNGAHYWADGKVWHVAARSVTYAQNITGAGDAFNAGFLWAVSAKKALVTSVEHAVAVAAEHVGNGRNA